ncbi:MlaD family protein [Lacisediminimonas sp.]|uniref:MlaD family protein n=1 Tax=Lacisediminimonas sp. TaxID=3060582 RepID=UPI002729304D|nr:MlaD family protein [Lacisediminimonas sp.]MDO8299379.1 MlaD family protein [Lacisediminimonas sp.]
MENKSHALMAGLFSIVLLVGAVLAGLWLNRDRESRLPYEIATKLSIPGLNPQAAVRYRGLAVGRVDEIVFDPQTAGQILIRISILDDTPVTRSTYGTLGYQGVTGIAFIELNDDGKNPVRLHSTAGQVARIELRPSLLNKLEERGLAILTQAEELTRRVNDLLSDQNRQSMLQAFDSVSKAAQQLERIPQQMQPTLARLPGLANDAQRAVKSIDLLAQNLSEMTNGLKAANGPIERIGKTADTIATVAERFEHDLLPLTSEIRSSLRLFNRTLENINDRPQSILFGSRRAEPGPGEGGFSSTGR